jgi:nucleotide-binding universal stress UspA family protein
MVPKKILLCTDFSENSRGAQQLAVDYAQAFGAQLVILHVINSSRIGYPSLEERIPIDIKETLNRIQDAVDKALGLVCAECTSSSLDVKTYSRMGTPAREIVRFAQEESVQLIITGTHGWTGFKHLIMGSTAENVVRTATCPVITVRSASGS